MTVDLVDAEHVGLVDDDLFEGFVLAQSVGQRGEDGDDPVGVDAGIYADGEGGNREVAGEIGDGRDLAVRHDVDRAVAVAESGAAQSEVFDGALEAGDFDRVANVVLVFDKDEDAVEHVLEEGLCAETDAEADDSGRRDEGPERDTDGAEQLHGDVDQDEGVGGGADDAGGGAKLRSALVVSDEAVGAAPHALDEEKRQALQDEGDDKCDNNLGQAVLQEGNEVGVPAVFEGTKRVLVLWDVVGKLHDVGVPRFLHYREDS